MSNMARHLTLQSMKDKVAAVPGEEGAFLINAYGMMYEEITASCLIKIDLAGNMALSALDGGVHRLELTARSPLAATATVAKLGKRAGQGAAGNLHGLPVADAPTVWRDGVAGAPEEARPDGSRLGNNSDLP